AHRGGGAAGDRLRGADAEPGCRPPRGAAATPRFTARFAGNRRALAGGWAGALPDGASGVRRHPRFHAGGAQRLRPGAHADLGGPERGGGEAGDAPTLDVLPARWAGLSRGTADRLVHAATAEAAARDPDGPGGGESSADAGRTAGAGPAAGHR